DTERDAFIERFWKLRDTDPSTEENEFRTEHYSRIQYANEHLYDGIPGWKTDRGRIWMLHGAPDSRHYEYGAGSLGIDVENPTEVLTGEGNPERRRAYRLTLGRPETEIWIYYHIDGARNVPGYFEVIFSRTDPARLWELNQNLRHISSSGNLNYGMRVQRDISIMTFLRGYSFGGPFRIVYAGAYRLQDMDDFFQSIFHPQRMPSLHVMDFQAAVSDLERSSGEALMERLAVGRRLKDLVRTRVFFQDLPIDLRAGTLKAASGGTWLPLSLSLACRDSEGRAAFDGDTLDLLLELIGRDGEVKASLADSLYLVRGGTSEAGEEGFLYQTRLGARPGIYRLAVYAALRRRPASAHREMNIELPDYGSGDLAISDLLLFEKVVPKRLYEAGRSAAGGLPSFLGGSRPVYLKDYVLIPSGDSRFRRGQKLTAFFEVYGPGLSPSDQAPSLKVRCRLKTRNGSAVQLPERQLDYLTDVGTRCTTYGVSLPLLGFPVGDYSVEFEVYDTVLEKSVRKSAAFSIY
ncbi:MAG: GWxTD domain-containing protein, partial [Acidobacteria bacterium]|nr:GWxTD domain-containing protein [Acidobacteriota bacterium]